MYSLIPQYTDVDKSMQCKGGCCFFLILQWEYSSLWSQTTTKYIDHWYRQQWPIQYSAIDFAVSNRLTSALLRGRTEFKEHRCHSAWVFTSSIDLEYYVR